jgi:hypothetical protein
MTSLLAENGSIGSIHLIFSSLNDHKLSLRALSEIFFVIILVSPVFNEMLVYVNQ